MSAYRRFISYLYDCRHSARQKNCGFLKIEVRGGRCLIFFQLKNAPCQEACNVYLCFRDKEPAYVFLHTLPVHHGNVQFKIETSSIHMMGSPYAFSQCSGILCTDEKGNHCYASWDGKGELPLYNKKILPIINETDNDRAKKVSLQKEERIDDAPDDDHSDNSSSHNDACTADSLDNDHSDNTSHNNACTAVPPDNDCSENTSHNDVRTADSSDDNDQYTEKSAANPTPDDTPIPPKNFTEIWAHMQQEFQPLDPFEDSAVVEGIKITPSDLGYLQPLNLDLGTNQFLLHGYKSYHHLLMGRLHGHFQYVIGVPGIYDPQEQFMAKMFGFPCFKPIRESRQKNGQFGYWMRCFRHPR